MKEANPELKICFVGPHVTVLPEESLAASEAIDFIVRKEFDHSVVDYANGTALREIPSASFRENGGFVHNPEAQPIDDLDTLPWVTKVYKRDLDIERYNVPFLLHPFLAFYTERGCPALCTFCLWPQTLSGHRWRTRSAEDVAGEVEWTLGNFPGLKEIFFDDDTFKHSQVARDRAVREAEAAQFHVVLHVTGDGGLRNSESHERRGLQASHCRLRVR